MKKILIITTIVLTVVLILTGLYFYFFKKNYIYYNNNDGARLALKATLAITSAEKEKGLSGTPKLEDNQAMLFVNNKDSKTPFWMIDMLIPLDIIFLNKDLKVVYIERNAQPCASADNCSLIIPTQSYRYVVEVNAGFADKNGTAVGDYFIKNFLTFVP